MKPIMKISMTHQNKINLLRRSLSPPNWIILKILNNVVTRSLKYLKKYWNVSLILLSKCKLLRKFIRESKSLSVRKDCYCSLASIWPCICSKQYSIRKSALFGVSTPKSSSTFQTTRIPGLEMQPSMDSASSFKKVPYKFLVRPRPVAFWRFFRKPTHLPSKKTRKVISLLTTAKKMWYRLLECC